MSRRAKFRGAYLDEDDYDDYDAYDDYDDYNDQQNSANLETHTEAQQAGRSQSQNPLDDSLLEDILQQFRFVLSDDTLTTAQVDEALHEADYDWEVALAALKTQRPTAAAEQATPSPIAALLMDETSEKNLPFPPPTPISPDYDGFVADQGTTLSPSKSAQTLGEDPSITQPFRFDRPSPDDIVRAKQARATNRTTPALRLPRPSQPRQHKRAVNITNEAVAGPSHSVQDAPAAVPAAENTAVKSAAGEKPTSGQLRVNTNTKVVKVERQRLKKVNISTRVSNTTPSVAVIVAGHVDAGKSTLLGHLLHELAPKSRRAPRNLAWTTDEDAMERKHGVTIGIASRMIQRPTRALALIDAPGHRDFTPAMMLGTAQASCAILVVDASPGEFESGFSESGQTREHAVVLKALGVTSLLVVINKMDVVNFAQARFDRVRKAISDFLAGNGWKQSVTSNVRFLPASGLDGTNLTKRPADSHALSKWYKGRSLLEELDSLPGASKAQVKQLSERATRFLVSDFYESATLGGQAAVTGRLLSGSIAPKDRLFVTPRGVSVTVKSLSLGEGGTRIPFAVAAVDAVPVSLSLVDMAEGEIECGSVLCDPEAKVLCVLRFRARVLLTGPDVMLLQGTQGVLHVGGVAEAAHVAKLCEYKGTRKGRSNFTPSGKKRVPRKLIKGDAAVIEMHCERAVALEKTDNMKALGRFAFRVGEQTAAVGVVLDILEEAGNCDTANENAEGDGCSGDDDGSIS